MKIQDEVATKVKSVVEQKAPASGLLNALVEYLNRPDTGGLQGLVQKFEKAGLAPQIQSWIGKGKQLPITPEEVTRALGGAEISQMAAKAGVPTEEVSRQLSELLPDAVNHLTPAGELPAAGVIGELGSSVKEKFGK